MKCRTGTIVAIFSTAIMLGGQPGGAQTIPAETAPPRTSTPWNAATAQPPPSPPAADDSALSLRIYDELTTRSPLPYRPRRPDDPAYAVDVSAIMSRCADGRLVITALLIGGHLTPLDNRCDTESGSAFDGPAAPCDASAWNCSSKPVK